MEGAEDNKGITIMKRYWRARGGMIEEDNGEYMLSSEVLPEIDRLNARIAELEARLELETAANNDSVNMAARIEELENENRHLYQQIGIQADIEKAITTSLRAKIKELETAQQWHPASEPPECKEDELFSRRVLIQEKNGDCFTDWYCYESKTWYFSKRIIRWRDLPPAPEVKA